MKKIFSLLSGFIIACAFVANVAAADRPVLLGFVQVSAEGAWRQANTTSVQEAAKAAGIDLILRVGKNNKENQVKEMRELIAQNVDVLAFSPSQTDGWDEVLAEAKAAGIPVIVLDREIVTKDQSLYVTCIGSDMLDEGKRAGKWLVKYMNTKKPKGAVKIVELQGVEGSTPAVFRKKGFDEIIAGDKRFKVVASKPANFTVAKGKEVMAEFLKAHDGKIDAVFAHNDEMALGAIEAVQEYGLKPGKDVVILGVDAIKKAFEAMVAGTMNCSIECSPLLGPQLMQAVQDVKAGKPVQKRIITIEKDYPAETAAQEIGKRTY